MKAPGMTMYTNEGHSTAQVIKYVLEDRDPFSTPRYAVEEVLLITNMNLHFHNLGIMEI